MEDPIYTCKIQLISFSDDEFEEKGIVDLEKALDIFEIFPWNEQFEDFKNGVDTLGIPSIIFQSSESKQLTIDAQDNTGFNLMYENKITSRYSMFFASNDYLKSNYKIEDVITMFFKNTLEENFKLEPFPESKGDVFESIKNQQELTIVETPYKGFIVFSLILIALTIFVVLIFI